MEQRITDLLDRIEALRGELERELDSVRFLHGLRLRDKIVEFEQEALAAHRRLRLGIVRFIRASSLTTIVTAPLIYSLIVPLVLIDLWVGLYQAVCFRALGVVRVRRSEYIVPDRRHLAYLNRIEALNCLYCSYANG
jgi:hypothetical protein